MKCRHAGNLCLFTRKAYLLVKKNLLRYITFEGCKADRLAYDVTAEGKDCFFSLFPWQRSLSYSAPVLETREHHQERGAGRGDSERVLLGMSHFESLL